MSCNESCFILLFGGAGDYFSAPEKIGVCEMSGRRGADMHSGVPCGQQQ